MHRRRFLTTLAALPVAGCALNRKSTPLATAPSAEIRELAALLPELMAEFKVPGVSIACVRGGELVFSRAFGFKNSHSKVPADHETLFEAASVSKTVFAYAALKLCDRGILQLDTPLTRYTATPFAPGEPRLNRITARQVLSHSAGFAEWRSSHRPLIPFEPGSCFEYSGEGYFYLQSVITGLTGEVDPSQCAQYEADFEVCATDFDDFMKRQLLRPFGMTLSGYLPDNGWDQRVAQGHDTAGQPLPKSRPRRSDVARYAAVGGLHTTATEYSKFLVEIVAPRRPDRYRLNQFMLGEMIRPHILLPEDGKIDGCDAWALGWGVQQRSNRPLLVHSGGQTGFRSLALASIENKSGLIILANSDNGGQIMFHPAFATLARELVLA
jgi:CubicO group peptidase (beta-lactamase class C family)